MRRSDEQRYALRGDERATPTPWKAFLRRRHTLLLRGAIESLVYPLAIILLAAVLSVSLAPDEAAARRELALRLATDFVLASSLLVVPVAVAIGTLERARSEREWVGWWWQVAGSLESGAGLATALQERRLPRPAGGARRSTPRIESASAHLHRALTRGLDIPTALTASGCPEPFPTILRDTGRESALPDVLARELDTIQHRLIRRTETWLRLTQPLAVAAAGVVVMWLVARIVLPLITRQMEGLYR